MIGPSPPPRRSTRLHSRRRARRRRSGGERSPRRRVWRRRLLIGLGSIVAFAALLVGGVLGYARWRFDQIKKVSITQLAPRPTAIASAPINLLLVGSDSRAFVTDPNQAHQYGTSTDVGGQRSDVIIVARIVPALHQVRLLSIPRDTWVNIPGTTSVSGDNRINAAFDSGPGLLVATISDDFHIPINNFIEVNFPGLVNMVNAVGGVGLDFRDPVTDSNSHLAILRTGCHLVMGAQALALVRSRYLHYEKNGVWYDDPYADLSRIQRQDAFFRALIPRITGVISSPTRINSLLGAAVSNLTFDQTLSEGEVFSLGRNFRGMTSADFSAETLPEIPWTTYGGASVLVPDPTVDEAVINRFLSFGGTTTATPVMLPPIEVTGISGITGVTGINGFTGVSGASGNSGTTGASGDSGTSGSSGAPGGSSTATTLPYGLSSSSLEANRQSEPWNPVPCTPK